MSPFAICLKQLRLSRGKKQNALAHELGFESSYLSALERGEKGPPQTDFIQRLIRGLSLNEDEQAALESARKVSARQISIPHTASEAEFRMIHELLVPQLGKLHPFQIQLIQLALSIPVSSAGAHKSVEATAQREDHIM